jgi:uncharacterized protein with GYD domain
MATFISLVKFSGESIKNIGDFGSVYQEGVKMGQQMGIKSIGAYATLGPYDAVFIYEAPDEKQPPLWSCPLPPNREAKRRPGQQSQWKSLPN